MAGVARRPPGKGSGARRAGVVSCWLCGVRLHASKMMPDGGDWCDDTRWYCRDAGACTRRWTTSRSVLSAGAEEPPQADPDSGSRAAVHLDQPARVSGEAGPAVSG